MAATTLKSKETNSGLGILMQVCLDAIDLRRTRILETATGPTYTVRVLIRKTNTADMTKRRSNETANEGDRK